MSAAATKLVKMLRPPHVLEPTKRHRLPKRVIYFDSESEVNITITDEEIERAENRAAGDEFVRKEHNPYLLCATFRKSRGGKVKRNKRRYFPRRFRGEALPLGSHTFLGDFWRDVDAFTHQSTQTVIYAHNAKYDVLVTGALHYLVRDHEYEVTSFSDSNPFFLDLRRVIGEDDEGNERAKTIRILSSTNYYAQSLKKLGEVFNLPKLEFDHEEEFDFDTALVYAERDVDILETSVEAFIDFVEREELGSLAGTIAGQAFLAYRAKFMPENTLHIHNDRNAIMLERRAYAGGRTECFRMGEIPGRVYYVDVNSMYPHVMKNHIYPVKLRTFWKSCSVAQLRNAISDHLICADVRVKTDAPVFFYKKERLIFPVGDFWTSLSTPEIIYALEHDLILEVKNVALYEAAYIFEDYVDYFYGKRLEAKDIGDAVHDFLYKIFLNSLYGKFGQRSDHWEEIDTADPARIDQYTVYEYQTKTSTTFRVFGGKVFEKAKAKTEEEAVDLESYNSFPAIAAHVTAYARMMLWEYIQVAGRENVYYCDTDSLFVNDEGYQHLWFADLLDNGVLGKLKLEDYGELTLYGCKDYVFKSERTAKVSEKIKGVSKNAVRLSADHEGRLRFAVTQWGGLPDRLKENDLLSYYNKVIIKTLKREYNKGTVIGGFVYPFELNYKKELEELQKKNQENAIREIADDLWVKDPIRKMVEIYGYIRNIRKGERWYNQFRELTMAQRIKYFRANGMEIDVWCADNGYSPDDLFDKFNFS
jgi:hypothetical protein